MFDKEKWRMDGTMSTGEESAQYVPQWGGEEPTNICVTLDLRYNFFEAATEPYPWLIGSRLSQRCDESNMVL